MSEITWRQRQIQITNEKVRLFFLNLEEFEDEIKVTERKSIIQKIFLFLIIEICCFI